MRGSQEDFAENPVPAGGPALTGFTADAQLAQDGRISSDCMIGPMTETPSTPSSPASPEAATGPVVTAQPPIHQPPAYVAPTVERGRHNRLNVVAAWVGIVAGVVFIVAVVFGTGFMLGAHSGGDRGGGRGPAPMMLHRDGPPPMMFPMGPRAQFEFPGPVGPGGPGGPAGPGQSPGALPGSPATPAPARP